MNTYGNTINLHIKGASKNREKIHMEEEKIQCFQNNMYHNWSLFIKHFHY